jgi:hypothetical protein
MTFSVTVSRALCAVVFMFGMGGCSPETIKDVVKKRVAERRASTRPRSQAQTILEWRSKPAVPKAGIPALWSLKVLNAKHKEGEEMKGFRTFEAPRGVAMHLFIVSRDLSHYAHMYPEPRDYGNFLVRPVLPQPGSYQFFVDYAPIDSFPIWQSQKFLVQPGSDTASIPAQRKLILTPVQNGWLQTKAFARPEQSFAPEPNAPAYLVKLKADSLAAGAPTTLTARVLDSNGAPVKDLVSHLEGAAYGVAISQDGINFVRLDAAPKNAAKPEEVRFEATFPTVGIYKLWLETRRDENVIIAPFVVKVQTVRETMKTLRTKSS